MPHPWIAKATFGDKGITFSVEVTDIMRTEGAIEITGEAMQANGAYAPISCIKDISEAQKGYPDPNDPVPTDRYFMDVDAVPATDHPFVTNLAITACVRVSKPWVTVLVPGGVNTETAGTAATAGAAWAYGVDTQVIAT